MKNSPFSSHILCGVRDAPRPQASFWQQLSYGRRAISQIQTTLWIELHYCIQSFVAFKTRQRDFNSPSNWTFTNQK